MTEMIPERGTAVDVKIEGQVQDGVFRIDVGVEDLAMVTLHFNSAGAEVLDQLLAVTQGQWPEVHDRIVESYEAAVLAEQNKEDENV